MPGGQSTDFFLRPLLVDDKVGSIQSGDEQFAALSRFLKKQAKKYEDANLARTYVIVDRAADRIAAYVTLVCSEVKSAEQTNGEPVHFPYSHYPAVKIARLLVDQRYRRDQGFGFGRYLIEFSIGVAREEICPAIGCRFVVVDSKRASVAFYEKCGFTMIDTAENRDLPEPVMFMDLHKAG